ncbi:hypothetical protein JTB14_019186 [Gonioctena quinquepunctata]|nr:hypothetical protein JTB14_019186 [Gonioctena quinquepunctata]
MVTTPPQTTNTTTLTTSTSTIGGNVPISTTAPTSLRVPAMYSLGMVATTLDDFSGKDAERYFEKLELRSKLDGWTEDETVKLLKLKLIGEAYNYLKSDTGLDSLSYYDLKNKFLKKFTPSKLPGESQWNLSRCFQRLDEELSSFCTRLRIIGAKLLREDLSGATPEGEAGIRKKNKELLLNQFKIGLRKDLMKETGVLLLREENLDLEKAENLVKLQETTLLMMQGRMSNMKISTVETERVCYTCGKPGHLARECHRTKSTQPMGSNLCFSCNYEGHWARDCPRNAPEEHKPGSQNFGRGFQGASEPPSRNWGPPSRNWGPPSRNWGPPSRNWGPPPRNWGPPMARARYNQARKQMGREEMGPFSGAVPKRRQEPRFSASGFSRNEENKRQLN